MRKFSVICSTFKSISASDNIDINLFVMIGERDTFMVSYLVAKGATGLPAGDIVTKSRKELAIENR